MIALIFKLKKYLGVEGKFVPFTHILLTIMLFFPTCCFKVPYFIISVLLRKLPLASFLREIF